MDGRSLADSMASAVIGLIVVAVLLGMVLGVGCTSCVGWWKHHRISVTATDKEAAP